MFKYEHIYPSVGRCIYCGALPTDADPLTDEHIIPQALGGKLELPEASCGSCQKIINDEIENTVLNTMFGTSRVHLGLQAKKPSKKEALKSMAKQAPIYYGRPGEKNPKSRMLPLAEHPHILFMPEFLPANIYFQPDPKVLENPKGVEVFQWIYELNPKATAKIKKEGRNFFMRNRFHIDKFVRMLAKIGYGYAVAELGYGSFEPIVSDLILGRYQPRDLNYYVGARMLGANFESSHQHALTGKIERQFTTGKSLIIVYIHLFSTLIAHDGSRAPLYHVVVGYPK